MNRFKQWVSALFGAKASAMRMLPDAERDQIGEYLKIYRGTPPWLGSCGGHSLGLGPVLCRELARTACAEVEAGLYGTERASYLREQIDRFLPRLADALSGVLGVGCGMLRLYPRSDGGIGVDFVLPDRYLVLSRDEDGNAKDVCFFEDCMQGDGNREAHYLRCEWHRMGDDGMYRIENRLYLMQDGEAREVALDCVERFAAYPVQTEITGVKEGFFVEWRHGSGEPIYSHAIALMKDADKQYDRLLWEFEGGELAVDASEEAFRCDADGVSILPAGKDRLFRMNTLDSGSENGELMRVFSPTLRDESLINGLNRILMAIEDAVGVARGTVSDPSLVAKTATEVKSMRQRTYLTVCDLRREIAQVLGRLLCAMDRLCGLYGLCKGGWYAHRISFDDGILIDSEQAREVDRADVAAGLMSREEYRRKWYKGGNENELDHG